LAMRGTVAAEGNEALLGVEVLSQAGSSSLRVEAVVDTGFTGHLTLPRATVDALGLPIIGSAESILADGSLVMEDVCLARVLWHGAERPVRVLVADATPLLGMALMRGSELRVECVGGGEVSVERLEEPSD
jgi:clan AA aspartic protease